MKAPRKDFTQKIKKATLWLIAELVVNLAGLDNLADYSEFVFEHSPINEMAIVSSITSIV